MNKEIKKLFVGFISLLALYSFPLLSADKIDVSFEGAMGENTGAWKYVQTKEDEQNIAFYKSLYDQNNALTASTTEKIPKIFHFIWLGPKDIPQQSLKNIETWLEKHPTWKAKFWTDRERIFSLDKVEQILIQQYPFAGLEELYYDAENYGEKSELLRYEVLHEEGGVYVDHDMRCVKNMEAFCQSYDFFCGLESLSTSFLSSSVFPSTHLIAAKPHHPIFAQAMAWLKENWHYLGQAYPGTQEEQVINRVKHRSFSALDLGIKRGANQNKNKDIVFPSSYFSLAEKDRALYATHAHLGMWHKIENLVEKKIEKEWREIRQKNHISQLLAYTVTAIQVAVLFFLGALFRRTKKRREEVHEKK